MNKRTVQKFPYPIKKFKDNLFLTIKGDVWSYYFVRSQNINMQDQSALESFKTDFRYTLQEIGKRYKEIDFKLLPYEVNLEEQYEELSADFDKRDPEIPEFYADRTIQYLEKAYGKITKPRFIIGIKLREYNEVTSRIDQLKGGMEDVKENLFDILGGGKKDNEEIFQMLQQEEIDLFQELGSFGATRLTTEDSSYLQKFPFLRNSKHSKADEEREQSISEITEAIIYPNVKRGILGIETEYGTQYLSILPVSSLPDYLENTRLFYRTQNLPFGTEFNIKARPQPNDGIVNGVKAKVSGKRKTYKSNYKEVVQSGDPASKRLAINMKKTEMIQEHIEDDLVVFDYIGAFFVTADTPEECRRRTRYLRKWFGKQKVKLECPVADQEKLFNAFLLGDDKGVKSWHQFANEHGLAEFLFGVTNELGNTIGFPIGVQTDGTQSVDRSKAVKMSRKIVYWNPLAINQNIQSASTASPHIDATGKTGSGKSFLMKLLFYILQLMNVKTMYFDPKTELEHVANELLNNPRFIKEYPHFAKMLSRIHYITLDSSDKKNHGVLDPLVFLPPTEAKDVAEGIIYQIYDLDKHDDIRTEVQETLNYLIEQREQGAKVGLLTLVEILLNHREKNIRQVGKIIKNEVENSVLELAFSDGTAEGLSLDFQSIVLSVAGLSLPEPKKNVKEYDKKERKSIAVMLCIGKYIRLFGSQNPTEYTYEIFDESWVLKSSSIGKEIINEIKRVGRSFCNACIFADQSVKSSGEAGELSGQVGMMFAFDEDSEREEILQTIGLSASPTNLELLRNLKQGQCIMRDTYDRTSKLSINCLFPEWRLASKTVERTASGNLEEKYA